MANQQTTAQLTIKINGKAVENSFTAIRKEVASLERDLRKLTPGTEAFQKKAQEVKEARAHFERVRNEINAVNQSLQQGEGFLSRFSKSVIGGLTIFDALGKVKNTALSTVDDLLKISDAITAIQKTSGLAQKDVEALFAEFGKFDTRTSRVELLNIAQIGGRLGITDKEELQEFTREIDKIYVALGDSFQGGLEEVTTKVGKLKNLFDETKNTDYATALNEIGSALNELGANGTASESNITDFATRIGQLPNALKPAIDRTLGLGAAFEEAGIDAEIASSGYSRFVSVAGNNIEAFAKQMKISTEEATALFRTNPEEFFIKFGESIKHLSADQTANVLKNLKLNTLEVQKALGAAGDNAGRFRDMMDLASQSMGEATSIQAEFDKVNNNSAAVWEKIIKTVREFFTDGIVPDFFNWITGVVGKITGVLSETGNGVEKFRQRMIFILQIIKVATTAFVGYKTVVIANTIATGNLTKATWLQTVADKAGVAALFLKRTAILAYNVVVGLLTLNTQRATNAMIAFNTVTKMNPWGVIIGLITAVAVAYKSFSKSLDETTEKQKRLAERHLKIQEAVDGERIKLQQLLEVARNENLSKADREKAIKKLNDLSPKYLGNLTLEKINTLEAKKAVDLYIQSLERKAEMEVLNEELKENLKKRREAQNKNTARYGEGVIDKGMNWLFGETELEDDIEKQLDKTMKVFEGKGYDEKFLKKERERQRKAIEHHYKAKKSDLNALESERNEILERLKKLNTENPEIILNEENDLSGNDNDNPDSKTTKKDYTSDYRNAQKARLQMEQELQKEITQSLEESLDKQLAMTEQKYNEKRFKLQQENADLELDIKTLSDEAKTNKDPLIQKIIEEKRQILELNKKIEIEIEKQKQAELTQVKDKWLLSQFEKETQMQQKEIKKRENILREEILLLNDTETAKQKIRESQFNTLSEKEISQLKTLEEAKKVLRNQADKEVLTLSLQSFETQKELLKSYLTSVSGEAKDKLLSDLEQLDEKMLQIREKLQNGDNAQQGKDSGLAHVDLLGFSGEQWEQMWTQLDTTEGKLNAITMGVSALNNAFSMFAQLQQNLNEKEMRSFSANQDKKKKALLDQLNQGYISQAQYQKETQRLEEEAETKRKELSLKQFKAQKAMNMMNIVANTATGIMRAYSDTGPIVGTAFAAIIAALGAVQLGIVASQQPPSYATGGRTQGLGFRDSSGHEVAGVVHANEYVIPEWLRKDPEVARVEQWLESKRIGNRQQIMGNSFAEGGRVAPANDYEAVNEQLQNIRSANNETALLSALERLIDLLEKLERDGIDAFVVADAKNGKEIQKAIKLYQDLKDKNKH